MALLKRFGAGDPGSNSPKDNGNGGNGSNNDSNRPMANQSPTIPRPAISSSLSTMEGLTDFKNRVQNKLLATLEPTTDMTRKEQLRSQIERVIDDMIIEEHITISRPEKIRLHESVCAELLGFGPLDILLEDEAITEIMVNGADHIYVEKRGKIIKANVTFESQALMLMPVFLTALV
jgi:pilus assembly protein CpaF